MLKVQVMKLNNNGDDVLVGELIQEGPDEPIQASEENNFTLQSILDADVWDGKQVFTAKGDPEGWLRALHAQYRSYALRCTRAGEF